MQGMKFFTGVALMLLLLVGCGGRREKVSEEIERNLETINNKITEIDKQMLDLRKSVESLQNDVNLKMVEVDNALLRLETSRMEAKAALDDILQLVRGETKRTVAERKVLPVGVRIILVIIVIVLLVILIKKATARPSEVPPGE